MIKISLMNTSIHVNILDATGKHDDFKIKNGDYEEEKFTHLIMTGNTLILEGAVNRVLFSNVVAVYLENTNIIDQLYQITKDDNIYIDKAAFLINCNADDLLKRLLSL